MENTFYIRKKILNTNDLYIYSYKSDAETKYDNYIYEERLFGERYWNERYFPNTCMYFQVTSVSSPKNTLSVITNKKHINTILKKEKIFYIKRNTFHRENLYINEKD